MRPDQSFTPSASSASGHGWGRPAVDSLRLRETGSAWPAGVLESAVLRAQAERRLHLAGRLRRELDGSVHQSGELQQSLAALLDEEPDAARLILYLPLELLPDRRREADARLVAAVLRRWWELLAVSDVRANFVDGDLVEGEPPPRVVKAAHLLPALMERRLVSAADVQALIERARGDEILLDSLADALPELLPQTAPPRRKDEPLAVSPARQDWQRRQRAEQAEQRRAEEVAAAILRRGSVAEALKNLPEAVDVEGTRIVLERLATEDLSRARAAYAACAPRLEALWRSAPDALVSLWSRLEAMGAIEDPPWARLGFSRPRLDGTHFGDPHLHELVARELGPLLDMPQLYPAGIFFGSRLKGYATSDADLDLAVFVRPGVTAAPRLPPKTVEFWLDERGDELAVHDFPAPEATRAGSDWVHVLFGGAWYGDRATIEMLHARLLAPYLRSRAPRAVWLEELERDVLQYRLLHRGYARLQPPRGGLPATATTAGLDPTSTFWDEGYRRLATLLYVERVFLPSVEA